LYVHLATAESADVVQRSSTDVHEATEWLAEAVVADE